MKTTLLSKNIFLVFFLLVIFLSPSFSVFAQEESETEKKNKSFADVISFEEGTFWWKINKSFLGIAEKVESFRSNQAEKFKTSLDKIDDERRENKDSKGFDKAIIIIKIFFLALLVFIFSLQIAFYILATIIVFLILRKIFNTIFGFFRDRNS